jgi:hypothetical protein
MNHDFINILSTGKKELINSFDYFFSFEILKQIYFFHIFTDPTTITTNIYIRKKEAMK